ncbi:HNH endonuclease [Neobacillus drentensis]|uniref:HNH endonuclease n=1 Tax=Neobacillus drentensis TaxID=220684 RepID=UPI002FFFB662
MDELNYKNPVFYTEEVRSQFTIISKVKVNTLPTLEEIREIYELHTFSDNYIAVFNTKSNQYIKPRIGNKNSPYFRYGLVTNDNITLTVYMHRVVGLLMVDGWSKEKVIDHLDGDKFNNLSDNLDWTSQTENVQRYLVRARKTRPASQLYMDKLNAV